MNRKLTRAELKHRARAGVLPYRKDKGKSYRRWYYARRRLGLSTHKPWRTAAQVKAWRRDYMRRYRAQKGRAGK